MRYNIKPDEFAKLKRNNFIAGILYALIGAFVFVGSFTIQAVKEFKPDLYVNFIKWFRFGTYQPYYQLQNDIAVILEDVPFMLIVGVILLLSALFHLITVSKKVNPEYNNNLQKGINKIRVINAIFNSVFAAILPILIGVNDISILALFFVMVVSYYLFSLSMEQASKERTVWTPYVGMVLTFLVNAGIIVLAIIKQLQMEQELLADLTIVEPLFQTMNYIIIGIFFFGWLLKLVHTFLQHKQVKKWKNPVFVESGYIYLNLIINVALVAIIFYSIVNDLFTLFYTNL